MQTFHFRNQINNRYIAISLSLLAIVFIFAFCHYLYHYTPAPWWTLIAPFAIVFTAIFLLFRKDTYLYIDYKKGELWGGNQIGRKAHRICKLQELMEVTYLPHTKEVKTLRGDGTRFYKFKDGEAFVTAVQNYFEQSENKEK